MARQFGVLQVKTIDPTAITPRKLLLCKHSFLLFTANLLNIQGQETFRQEN